MPWWMIDAETLPFFSAARELSHGSHGAHGRRWSWGERVRVRVRVRVRGEDEG